MMDKENPEEIKKKIAIFLSPKDKKSHGRPIYFQEAKSCGLNVEMIKPEAELWRKIYELYVRTNDFVSSPNASKCIESAHHSFVVPAPK